MSVTRPTPIFQLPRQSFNPAPLLTSSLPLPPPLANLCDVVLLVELLGGGAGGGHTGLGLVHNLVLLVGSNGSVIRRLDASSNGLRDLVPLVELLGRAVSLHQIFATVLVCSL